MTYQAHLSLKSANAKTGPIPVSTTSATTCPDACSFKANGCYAAGGPLAMHWRAVTTGKRGNAWADFVAQVAALPEGQLWRHNQAGDLPGDGQRIDGDALVQLINANTGKRGFTYTHYVPTGTNAALIHAANEAGFTVNLSADTLAQADQLASLAIGPVVVVVPSDTTANLETPQGRKVVLCPATQRDDVSCATCQLCQRQRTSIVGFPAHGASKKKADAVARRVIPIAVLSH